MQVLLHLELTLKLSQVLVIVLVDSLDVVDRLGLRNRLLLQICQDVILEKFYIFVFGLNILLSSI